MLFPMKTYNVSPNFASFSVHAYSCKIQLLFLELNKIHKQCYQISQSEKNILAISSKCDALTFEILSAAPRHSLKRRTCNSDGLKF